VSNALSAGFNKSFPSGLFLPLLVSHAGVENVRVELRDNIIGLVQIFFRINLFSIFQNKCKLTKSLLKLIKRQTI